MPLLHKHQIAETPLRGLGELSGPALLTENEKKIREIVLDLMDSSTLRFEIYKDLKERGLSAGFDACGAVDRPMIVAAESQLESLVNRVGVALDGERQEVKVSIVEEAAILLLNGQVSKATILAGDKETRTERLFFAAHECIAAYRILSRFGNDEVSSAVENAAQTRFLKEAENGNFPCLQALLEVASRPFAMSKPAYEAAARGLIASMQRVASVEEFEPILYAVGLMGGVPGWEVYADQRVSCELRNLCCRLVEKGDSSVGELAKYEGLRCFVLIPAVGLPSAEGAAVFYKGEWAVNLLALGTNQFADSLSRGIEAAGSTRDIGGLIALDGLLDKHLAACEGEQEKRRGEEQRVGLQSIVRETALFCLREGCLSQERARHALSSLMRKVCGDRFSGSQEVVDAAVSGIMALITKGQLPEEADRLHVWKVAEFLEDLPLAARASLALRHEVLSAVNALVQSEAGKIDALRRRQSAESKGLPLMLKASEAARAAERIASALYVESPYKGVIASTLRGVWETIEGPFRLGAKGMYYNDILAHFITERELLKRQRVGVERLIRRGGLGEARAACGKIMEDLLGNATVSEFHREYSRLLDLRSRCCGEEEERDAWIENSVAYKLMHMIPYDGEVIEGLERYADWLETKDGRSVAQGGSEGVSRSLRRIAGLLRDVATARKWNDRESTKLRAVTLESCAQECFDLSGVLGEKRGLAQALRESAQCMRIFAGGCA